MILRRLVRSHLILWMGFVALSLFISSAVIFSVRQKNDGAVVRRALRIKIDLADVFSALQDAEIGQRGYLLTGDTAFLEPYRSAVGRIDSKLDTLGQTLARVADLRAPFADLRALAAEKRGELEQTLALFREGRPGEALALVRDGSGKLLMDRIRARIDAMDAREDGIVASRQALVQRIGLFTAASTIVAVIMLGAVALAALREARRRAQLARFLPAEIAPRLAEGDPTLRHGREVSAAIVFVDIRDSTSLAETLPPTELSTILSAFRRAVSKAADETGGFVDKFLGDGAMIVFGAPDEDPAACSRALAFARALPAMLAASATTFAIGIGIHHGRVFCGIVGDAARLEFTVLGDVVNVASRIEAMTKTVPGTLLVSETVLLEAREPLAAWSKITEAPLRGRRGSIAVYAERAERERVAVAEGGPTPTAPAPAPVTPCRPPAP